MDLGEDGGGGGGGGGTVGFGRVSGGSEGGGGINFVEAGGAGGAGRLQHSNSNVSKNDGMDELVMEEYFDTGEGRKGRGGSGGGGGSGDGFRGGVVELKETAAGVGRSRR